MILRGETLAAGEIFGDLDARKTRFYSGKRPNFFVKIRNAFNFQIPGISKK